MRALREDGSFFSRLLEVFGMSRDQEILDRLAVISDQLVYLVDAVKFLKRKEQLIMVSVADIQAKANQTLDSVRAETDVVNAVKIVVDNQNAAIASLKQQVADLIAAGGADATALQQLSDTIDAIQSAETSNAAAVAEAVAAGTPAEPGAT